ncbi:MAG: transcription termination/antitermination protein NusG [Bacteroidales bacterium]|jgi:transcriptional antiterminator NusG|nr:transcription termination/antitermination protein NusG [Bacteroidales bacterium]
MNEDKKWYVVRTAGGKEKKAKENLEGILALRGKISRVFYPTEKVVMEVRGKKVTKDRSVLPGYLFIELNSELTAEIIYLVRNGQHVSGFIGDGKEPAAMRPEEVRRLLGQADEGLDIQSDLVNRFIIGESVKVKEGPFSNFSGKIESISADGKKLRVMISIFGRKTPIDLTHMQIERE